LSEHFSKQYQLKRAKELIDEGRSLLRNDKRQANLTPIGKYKIERAKAELDQSLSVWLQGQGRFAEAVQATQNAIPAAKQAETLSEGLNERSRVQGTYAYANALRFHIRSLLLASRLFEAEVMLRDLLQYVREKNLQGSFQYTLYLLATDIRIGQHRFSEGLRLSNLAQQALPDSVSRSAAMRIYTHNRKLSALLGMQRWQEAKNLLQEVDVQVNDDKLAKILWLNRFIRGVTYAMTGNVNESAALLKRGYEIYGERFGSDHYLTAQSAGLYALALAKQGQTAQAKDLFFKAIRGMQAPEGIGADFEDQGLRGLYRKLILEHYIGLLAPQAKAGDAAALDEVWRVMEDLRGSVVQQSVVDSAVRAMSNIAGVGELIRKEQDGKNEISALYGILIKQLSEPPERQLPKVVAEMRERIATLEAQRKRLRQSIATQFPEYFSLVHPHPPSLAEAATMLGEHEALISILPTLDKTYVLAINKNGRVAFHIVPVDEKAVTQWVQQAREQLDLAAQPAQSGMVKEVQGSVLNKLYAQLVQPVLSALDGKTHWIFAPAGALGQIPFAVLWTRSANGTGTDAMSTAPWLIRQAAISHVPSVSAWMAIRKMRSGQTSERISLIGFADPQFAISSPGSSASQGVTRRIQLTRAVSSLDDHKAANTLRYSQIPPLPETRNEVLDIAKALGADTQRDVFLGKEASRANVLKANLMNRRVVTFSTHGLVPGDLPGLNQPALALAATDSPGESPLLTLEDVFGLKMNADWVVLSACNTAAADGKASEAISGLGRGFFYAGTKAVLVTHWAVESESARQLVTEIFRRYGADRSVTRAETLRLAQLSLIDGKHYAHPFYWAPFAIVGDGGR
jgi:CHAT domain-containing protein